MRGDLLADIPDLLAVMRAGTIPGAAPTDGMPSGRGTNKAAPLSVSAVDDADDLYAALVEHAHATADAMDLPYPPLPHVKGSRGPMGLPATATPTSAATMGRAACKFIEYHLDFLATDLADDIYTDLQRRHSILSSRYPRRDSPQQIPARCPQCACLSVYRHPPRGYRAAEKYTCSTCLAVLDEAQAMQQCEIRQQEKRRSR